MDLKNRFDKITEKEFFKIKTLLNKKNMKFKLVGISMTPLIDPGSLITVSDIKDPYSLKLFDIVIFYDRARSTMICHYFLKYNIINDHMNTRPLHPFKGRDIPFPPQFLLGKVENFKINYFLKTKIFLKNLF